MDVANYVIFNAIFILIWLIFDNRSTFWPKYVMFIWGISLVFKAYRVGLLSFIQEYTNFLTPEWENKKVEELMNRQKPAPRNKVPLKRDTLKKANMAQK